MSGEKRKGRRDTLKEWRDWLKHQYVPGYYTGGRVPPFYRGPRPNRFGYVFLATGLIALAAALLSLTSGSGWLWDAVLAAFGALEIIAGIKLLSGRRGG